MPSRATKLSAYPLNDEQESKIIRGLTGLFEVIRPTRMVNICYMPSSCHQVGSKGIRDDQS